MVKSNQFTALVQTATLTEVELKTHIGTIFPNSCYYFLRYPHTVSGIQAGKPQELAPEGQIFDPKTELRWRKTGEKYQVLLLTTEAKTLDGFTPIPRQWVYDDHDAVVYPTTATRLPKPVKVPQKINLKQRYFRDSETSTIHFIALSTC